MDDLQRLSINQLTTRDQWSLPEAVDGYSRAGIGAMAVWWEKLREIGTERAAKTVSRCRHANQRLLRRRRNELIGSGALAGTIRQRSPHGR